ncbi:omega-3 polyunsaturated fatty acid synthase PfaB [Shewanella xiamenensis]|uniref:PfaB family protein n=1 Tax=Shewanella xiamenensis TaxID=332186 RepID=UPI0016424602|nr:PfaB family protein [Shewanella xiamenensis]TVL23367.1 omega-3 polyunsaturated fatty acid synthase PfaB [Shewanella xiamenensis]TVL24053.1 omega-3 polyunsaturated fatty acid synthase PfaB [Shewanella xiamenensis]TVL29211.1 omega-3 polyunsaturated fatty acid synthase PfaB [Shewanella xiamenensis]TVL37301.1 omega-3 polyunsaturated fatty acid synthase PfaB [Shewanella xiamenensis]TVP04986.1 omega-3 polyunsaturated fatty acid synthase PfaB [Shewanella xiamenensis]
MQSVLSHAQTDVSKLQQLMACRVLLNVEDKPLIDEPSDEPTLVALITDQLAHIAQKQLVEIRFEYQQQVRSLYLLDGLLAAQLHLHAEAYISALAQIQAETAEETNTINTNTVERCLNSAFTLAKRDCAQAVNCYAQASNLASQLNVLAQAVEALSHRSLKGIAPMLDATDAAQLAELHAEQYAELRAEKPVKNAQNGYWFTKPHQARVLSLNILSNLLDKPPQASTAQSLILTQGTRLIAQPLLNANRLFIPISGNTLESLTLKLSQLIDSLDLSVNQPDTDWLCTQGSDWFERYQAQDKLALVLMAGSLGELMQEAKAMRAYIEKTQQTPAPTPAQTPAANLAFKTPAGSYFTPTPLGDTGLTFVYPGVGTVYPNMFIDLHGYFPALYRELEREGDLAAMLQAEAIYQGAAYAKSAVDVKSAVDLKDSADMSLSQLAISGVGASYLFSRLLTRVFNIQPQLALGYSMGEAAMWASLDIWQTPHALINATQNSAIFNQEISGPLLAVRRDWQLSEDAPLVWNSFLVRASRAEINALLNDFPRVYLAIEQGDTCILAGCEASCLQLLKRLNKRGIASHKVTAMHTPPSQSQHSAIQGFYTLGLKANACETQVRFISAAQQSTVSIDSQSIAKSIADTFCAPLNFTALINAAYQQGARLFVEVGADRQTSTLIDKIGRQLEFGADGVQTQEQPIFAMACNAKGSDTITSLLKCLAQLISHRVPLSLAPLMPQSAAQSATPCADKIAYKIADKATAKTIAPHSASASALGHYSNVFQEGEPL